MTPFNKYHGAGNDFIIIDDREETFEIDAERIARMCHRQYGIGSDGLILLQKSEVADGKMRMFNAKDGKESPMCGNGLRCLVGLIRDLGHDKELCTVETMNKTYNCIIRGNRVEVDMGVPKLIETEGTVQFGEETIPYMMLDTGVPHVVNFVETIDLDDFLKRARFLHRNEKIEPHGINVNFATVDDSGTIHMRTYERGVEAETFACGTGATAVCVSVWLRTKRSGPLNVIFGSGEKLEFEVSAEGKTLKGLTMRGPIQRVFAGSM